MPRREDFGKLDLFFYQIGKRYTIGHHDCIDRFERNQSDFSLGYNDIHGTEGKYSALVSAFPLSLNLLSGYNVYEYQKEQDNWVKQRMRVLENFESYQPAVHALGAVWLIALLNKSFDHFCSLKDASCTRWRLLSPLFHTALFFLLTPFCILFKTNQVVTKEPSIISSYEQIMSQKVQVVYSNIRMNDTHLLK